MNRDESCGNCLFFHIDKCRHDPPAIVVTTHQSPPQQCWTADGAQWIPSPVNTSWTATQPPTSPNGWCGKWYPNSDLARLARRAERERETE